jgi:alkanesulfonate monooxygenase SsuD/methylene tetrahydromethanopterin reductase-like flavin-dependent oxidoreductase (luciferase family)
LKLGAVFPQTEIGADPGGVRAYAEAVEEIGFDHLRAYDHVLGADRERHPHLTGPYRTEHMFHEILVLFGYLAAVTSRIELGTGVLQIPLRNPVDLAHRILTTHLVSGGRLRLGVGAGSTAADFTALGMDFPSRFRRLGEDLSTMKKLWAGERVGEAQLGTWPAAAGGPPIFIGSWAGSRWIERAAREFDGWVGSGARSSWQKVTDGIARFRSLGGKRAILTNVVVRLDSPTASPEGPDDPFDLACPPEIARQRVARIKSLGYDDLVLVSRRHDEAHLRQLRGLL